MSFQTPLVVSLACAALLANVAPARAADPIMYLTWGAPWGQPGARASQKAIADTTRADTLFMSFDPGDRAEAFSGLTAVLYFWPSPGDTLGPFWHFARTAENPMACRIDFDVAGYEDLSPWGSAGVGLPRYENTSGSGRLSFIYAIPATEAKKLEAGKTYCIARVTISRRRARLSGFRQPMCIEWGDANFALTSDHQVDARGGDHAVVSWNSPDGRACEGFGKVRGAVTLADSTRGWRGLPTGGAAPPVPKPEGPAPPPRPKPGTSSNHP